VLLLADIIRSPVKVFLDAPGLLLLEHFLALHFLLEAAGLFQVGFHAFMFGSYRNFSFM